MPKNVTQNLIEELLLSGRRELGEEIGTHRLKELL
jgi:hypothetical protein